MSIRRLRNRRTCLIGPETRSPPRSLRLPVKPRTRLFRYRSRPVRRSKCPSRLCRKVWRIMRRLHPELFDKKHPSPWDDFTLSRLCGARHGSIGVWIEDKNSGTILLQQAIRSQWPATAIDSKLTAMGKDERALSVSGYVYRRVSNTLTMPSTRLQSTSVNRAITLSTRSKAFGSATRTASEKTIFWIRFAMG